MAGRRLIRGACAWRSCEDCVEPKKRIRFGMPDTVTADKPNGKQRWCGRPPSTPQ
jgi:hypothetical protein